MPTRRRFHAGTAGNEGAVKARVFAVGVLAVAVVVGTAGAGGGRPAVRVTDERPLTVTGARFKRAERVTVSAFVASRLAKKTVTASSTGRFTVRFRRVAVDGCSMYVVRAVGQKGSRAGFRQTPPPCGTHP